MNRGTDNGIRGIYRSATAAPLPVLSSELFLAMTNTRLGEPFVISAGGAYVPVVVVQTVNYFPTLDPSNDPFLIMDVDSLIQFVELRGLSELGANELFIRTDPAQHEATAEVIRDGFRAAAVGDRAERLQESLVDPVAVAGWRGIGLVGVGVTGLAAVLGYVTYLSAHGRRTRADAAYLRSLGFTRTSYFGMALVEHTLVAVLGVGLGIASGVVISGLSVASVAHTATGRALLPPFVLMTDWLPVSLVLAAVVVAAVVSVTGILRAFSRAPVHELVRARE
jgi:hypothetical protein